MIKRTPLFEKHLSLGGKMVPFAGWEMPVSYPAGIIAEHKAVRATCGIFDIGHMGIIKLKAPACPAGRQSSKLKTAEEFINRIGTNDVSRLNDFSSQYSTICNEQGGVIDDILVYKLPAHFIIIANASNADKVLKWFHSQAKQVEIEPMDNLTLLAIQGPTSPEVARALFGEKIDLKRNRCMYVGDILVSHTGYTGEAGFEMFVPKEQAGKIWDRLIEMKIQPCGLGARDTLRLEAGLPLYGHEYDENTSPLEAGYGWAVKFEKPDFIGRQKLLEEKNKGLKKILRGIVLSEKIVPRNGFKVVGENGEPIGMVTSGTFSPTLEKPIALAYINGGWKGARVGVEIRGKIANGEIVPLPFYKHA